VLKGGTAINLFYLPLPRLSVDIDFNYIGALPRPAMLAERPQVTADLEAIFQAQGYRIEKDEEYAAVLYTLRYTNSAGNPDVVRVEVNFLLRISLYGEEVREAVTIDEDLRVHARLLTLEELFAGKLKALLERRAPRDLYDSYRFLTAGMPLDEGRRRQALLFLLATIPEDVRTYSAERLNVITPRQIREDLWPTLRRNERIQQEAMIAVVKPFIASLLRWTPQERQFFETLMAGEYQPELLFQDPVLAMRIREHPAILWRLEGIRRHGPEPRSGPKGGRKHRDS